MCKNMLLSCPLPVVYVWVLNMDMVSILDAFAKLRKATINIVICVFPSVRPSARNTSAPTEGIYMKFII